MIKGKLKVFSLGADWFYQEMDKQDLDLKKVDWTPPIEVPDDIGDILKSIRTKKLEA